MEARHGLRHRRSPRTRARSCGAWRACGHTLHAPDDILGEDEIHWLEPALNDRVKGGLHLHEQWNVKADTLVDGLGVKVRAMGVDVLEGAEAIEFDRPNGRPVRACNGAGDIAADPPVLAAGSGRLG